MTVASPSFVVAWAVSPPFGTLVALLAVRIAAVETAVVSAWDRAVVYEEVCWAFVGFASVAFASVAVVAVGCCAVAAAVAWHAPVNHDRFCPRICFHCGFYHLRRCRLPMLW